MLEGLLAVLGPVFTKVLNFIPDPVARAKAEAELQVQLMAHETELLKLFAQADTNQTDINKVEAQSSSLFVSGWRPFVGWVCGVGVAWTFVLQPACDWVLAIYKPGVVTPILETGQLMSLLLGLLGMGAMRSYDKMKGTSK
jgi:Holin of 3TMs, for gene-transfer release